VCCCALLCGIVACHGRAEWRRVCFVSISLWNSALVTLYQLHCYILSAAFHRLPAPALCLSPRPRTRPRIALPSQLSVSLVPSPRPALSPSPSPGSFSPSPDPCPQLPLPVPGSLSPSYESWEMISRTGLSLLLSLLAVPCPGALSCGCTDKPSPPGCFNVTRPPVVLGE